MKTTVKTPESFGSLVSRLFPSLKEIPPSVSNKDIKDVTPYRMTSRRPMIWRVERLAPSGETQTQGKSVTLDSLDSDSNDSDVTFFQLAA
jgi:hypothetical protein